MRGAAPSITCPRCAKVAPPADAIGKFTTCLDCGMIFDAAAEDRMVPVRRSKRAAAETPAADKDVKSFWRQPLRARQAVLIVLAVFVGAVIKLEFFPDEEDVARQAEIDEIQRATRETRERYETQLGKRVSLPSTGVPSCDVLARMVVDDACTSGKTDELVLEIDAAVARTAKAHGAITACDTAIADITAARKRLACD